MRYRDIKPLKESTSPSSQISQLIQTILMTMTANGETEIDPSVIADELQSKFNMSVGLGIIIEVCKNLSIVQSADENSIVLGNEREMPAEEGSEESSKEKVAQMASQSPAGKPGIDTWTTT